MSNHSRLSKLQLSNIIKSFVDYITDSKFTSMRNSMKEKRDKSSFDKMHSFLEDKIKGLLIKILKSYEFEYNHKIQLVFADSDNVVYYYTDINVRRCFSKKQTIVTDNFKMDRNDSFNLYSIGKGIKNIAFISKSLQNVPKDGTWIEMSNGFQSKYTGSTVSYLVENVLTYEIEEVTNASYNDDISGNDYTGIEVYSGEINLKWTYIPEFTKFNTLCIGSGGQSEDNHLGNGGAGGGGIVWYPDSNYSTDIYINNGYTNINAYLSNSSLAPDRSYISSCYDNNNNLVSQFIASSGANSADNGSNAGAGSGNNGGLTQANIYSGGKGGQSEHDYPGDGYDSGLISVTLPYSNTPIYPGGGGGAYNYDLGNAHTYGVGGCGYGGSANVYFSASPNGYSSSRGGQWGGGASKGGNTYGLVSISWKNSMVVNYDNLVNLINPNNLHLYIYTVNGYNVYMFYCENETDGSSTLNGYSDFNFTQNFTGTMIIVGGGGAGGTGKNERSGGGGAGGNTAIYENIQFNNQDIYTITVGSGGVRAGNLNGSDSVLEFSNGTSLSAAGGNGGANATSDAGGSGGTGSNGGSGGNGSTKTPGAGTNGQYYNYKTEYGEIISVGGGGGGGKNNGGNGYGAGYGGNNGIGGAGGNPDVYTTSAGNGIGYGAAGGGGAGRESGSNIDKKGGNGHSGLVIIYSKF